MAHLSQPPSKPQTGPSLLLVDCAAAVTVGGGWLAWRYLDFLALTPRLVLVVALPWLVFAALLWLFRAPTTQRKPD